MAATTSSGGSSKSKGARDTSGTGLASKSGDSDNGATSGVEEEAIAEEVSAEEAMPDITELITGITGDDSTLQMLYQIRGKGDDGLITTPNFDWTDDNIDDVGSYISSGEVGILRNYWTDSATAKAVILYYTVCDASPDFAEVDTVGDTLMDRWVEDQWDSLLESGAEWTEIEVSPCEITAEYSLGLPIEIEESLWAWHPREIQRRPQEHVCVCRAGHIQPLIYHLNFRRRLNNEHIYRSNIRRF